MKKRPGSRKCEFRDAPSKCCATWQTKRPFEKTIVANVLKNDSAVVAAEEVICERINIESPNKFKIMEWCIQKLKYDAFNEDGIRVSQAVKTVARL